MRPRVIPPARVDAQVERSFGGVVIANASKQRSNAVRTDSSRQDDRKTISTMR
jgi:hypothetical protein